MCSKIDEGFVHISDVVFNVELLSEWAIDIGTEEE